MGPVDEGAQVEATPTGRPHRLGDRPGLPATAWSLLLYDGVLLVLAVAVLLLALAGLRAGRAELAHTHVVELLGRTITLPGRVDRVGFGMAAAVINLWSLQVPGYGAVSVVDGLYLGLLVIFGGGTTSLIIVAAGAAKALRDLLGWKRPAVFVAYSFLHPIVSFGMGGLVYGLTAAPGPLFASGPRALLQDIAALALTALVVAVLQGGFTAGARVLHRRLRFYAQMIPIFRVKLYLLILAPLGLLVAALYELAPVGLVLLVFPVAMIYRTLKNYTEVLIEARSTIEEMAVAVEKREPYTQKHSERVSLYAESTARQLRLPEEEVDAVASAGKLHDLGKISVADCILTKMEALDEDEFSEVMRHPEVGSAVAGKFNLFTRHGDVAGLIRQHHERHDGKGYPDGLKGDQIMLGARILAVAEAWDTMTTDRSYRPAMPRPEAMEKLRQGRGSQFDPTVVDAFLEMLKTQPEVTQGGHS